MAYDLISLNEVSMVARLLLATLCSLALGFERVRKRRAAGARTYVLVCIGAALVMMTGQFVQENYSPGSDAMRIGAQVVSGIGFLGAGTILVTGQHKIKGLTTAAGLWAAACVGIAIGAGFYLGGVTVTVMIFITMTVLDRLQMGIEKKMHSLQLYALFSNLQALSSFLLFARENGLAVYDLETLRVESAEGLGVNFTIKPEKRMSHAEVMELLGRHEGVAFVEEL